VGNDSQFALMVAAVGRPLMAEDPIFRTNSSRVRHRAELVRQLEDSLARHPADHWVETFTAAGVPCSAVNNIEQAIDLATRLGLNPVTELASDAGLVSVLTNPIGLGRTPLRHATAPPALGADNDGVRSWLLANDE
jgi:formyl-CoA transferase